MDEVSTLKGGTEVALFINGKPTQCFILPYSAFGFAAPADRNALGPSSTEKGDRISFTLEIINGTKRGPPREFLLANTAVLLALAKGKTDLMDCSDEVQLADNLLEEKRNGKPALMETVRRAADILRV